MARTGEKLRLECEVESVPESVFTWTKDGKPIKESPDIIVTKYIIISKFDFNKFY